MFEQKGGKHNLIIASAGDSNMPAKGSTMPYRELDQAGGAWHLDKRVPVALILAIVMQLGGVVWAVSTSFERIETNIRGISTLAERVRGSERATSSHAVQLGRIEEQVRGMRGDMNRLLSVIERRTP